jgi:hypothetical protein
MRHAGLILLLAALPAAVTAADAKFTPRTLYDCALLLPKGTTYEFKIEGSVDATKPKPVFKARTRVSGETEDPAEFDKSIQPFQACVNHLVAG